MPPVPDADTAGSSPADLDTSTTPVLPADTSGPQAPDTTTGDDVASPPDAPADDKAGLLAAVQSVVKAKAENPPKGEASAAVPGKDNPSDATKTAEATADPALEADPTPEEIAEFKPRTKARVEKLLAQRNAARTEVESFKEPAAKWEQMNAYLTRNDLAAEDVNLLLGVGAALRRGDFKAFLDGVGPYVELCNQALGKTLPADLNTKVEAGELTAEAARELSTTRFANARLKGEADAKDQAAKAARDADDEARIVNSVQSAVTSWEQDVRARDPDYAKKATLVLRISQALIANHGRPRTAEAAVELAKRAYEEANATFTAARPAPVPTLPNPSGTRTTSNARPEPKSLMEAAMMGLERSRRG